MDANRTTQPNDPADNQANAVKGTNYWITGDKPMPGVHRSYLMIFSDEAKKPSNDSLTKADASKRIDELREKTGRRSSRF